MSTVESVMALVGGREVHPINVRVGGFYRAPTQAELRTLADPLERARETALETVRWAATLPFPEVELEPEHVAL
jgi:sulfhydrogenase subunit alpha